MSRDFVQGRQLAGLSGILHGFFGKTTGTGEDLNVSLKLAASPKAAETARSRAVEELRPGLTLCALTQVHSSTVLTLDGPLEGSPEADGMVTNVPGLALGIVTADCAPILFADPEAGIIAAAHAGWRGAVNGIAGETVRAMTALGAAPERIAAVIGPAISYENYEIGEALAADIVATNPDAKMRIGIPPGGRKPHFDVPGFLRDELARAGVAAVGQTGGCTYAQPGRYFSHRYFTHHGGPQGRQLALIARGDKT